LPRKKKIPKPSKQWKEWATKLNGAQTKDQKRFLPHRGERRRGKEGKHQKKKEKKKTTHTQKKKNCFLSSVGGSPVFCFFFFDTFDSQPPRFPLFAPDRKKKRRNPIQGWDRTVPCPSITEKAGFFPGLPKKRAFPS
jgi:hypothetical protein